MTFTLQPAVKDDFIDREDILADMLSTLENKYTRMGFALVGPRRIGKTSILKEVVRRLEGKKGIVPVYFSLWDLVENTLPELCSRITLSIVEGFKPHLSLKLKMKQLLNVPVLKFFEVLRSLDIKLSFFDEIEMALRMGKKGEIDSNTLVEKVFLFGEKIAKENGVRLVLALDEFPSIMDVKNKRKLGEGIIKKMRTIYEDLENTILCISGSIRKTMEITALSPSSAFYRQFIIKNIEPFDLEATTEILENNLGVKLSAEVISRLYGFTEGIPFYLQCLGRELGRFSPASVGLQEIEHSFDQFLLQEGDILFAEQIKSFSDKEKIILSRMACYGLKTPAEIQKSSDEPSNVISRYMEYFLSKAVLQREKKGVYQFTDPVFKEWLKRRFVPTDL
ncbi:MAG: ATP-binding protein [Thermodesulfobacteriota bacterium]|nr:ATP-binding protein [Thermodesulfobacteriota bacterium]